MELTYKKRLLIGGASHGETCDVDADVVTKRLPTTPIGVDQMGNVVRGNAELTQYTLRTLKEGNDVAYFYAPPHLSDIQAIAFLLNGQSDDPN